MNTSGFSIGKTFKWILILCSVAFIGFAGYFILTNKKAIQLTFPDLHDINYVSAVIRNDSAYTKLSVVLQNKNFYDLNIDTLYFDVKLNDTSIAKQIVPLRIRQSSAQKDTVKVRLDLSIKKIQSLLRHLENQDSTFVEASGYVIYQTFLGRTKFNFNKRSRITTPVPPKIKLVGLKKERFDLRTKTQLTNVVIEIKNPSKTLDLHLSNIHYELNINNELFSTDNVNKILHVKPGSSIRVNVPMHIKVQHPLKTKMLILTDKDRLPYTLAISGRIKEHLSDKEFSSPVQLKVSGTMELEK